MRSALFAFAIAIAVGTSLAQNANAQATPSGSPATTTGQSTTGQSTAGTSTTGSAMTTQTAPAPLNANTPINPAPGTSAPLSNAPQQRTARTRGHRLVRNSNSFQNGTNGTVESNGVVNGTAAMTPPPLAAPTSNSTNGPANAPGTVASPTPAVGNPNTKTNGH
jgi:hypothetical protein